MFIMLFLSLLLFNDKITVKCFNIFCFNNLTTRYEASVIPIACKIELIVFSECYECF